MDLKDFVKTAIVSVVEGIAEAQVAVAAKGGLLNPADRTLAQSQARTIEVDAEHSAHAVVEEIEFDVAVTTGREGGKDGGVGIKVWSVELGGKAHETTTNETVSRIKFTVPIVYPPQVDSTVQRGRETKQRLQDAQVRRSADTAYDPFRRG